MQKSQIFPSPSEDQAQKFLLEPSSNNSLLFAGTTTQWSQPQIAQQHRMQAPLFTEWDPNKISWAETVRDCRDGVVQFDAHGTRISNMHQKRKSDVALHILPTKQFITEEKITAHFNGLHISSDFIQNNNNALDTGGTQEDSFVSNFENTSSGKDFTNLTFHDYQTTAKELAEKLKNATSIVINKEVRKLSAQQNMDILPGPLLQRFEKPCTALIPYVPPSQSLEWLRQSDTTDEAVEMPSSYSVLEEDNEVEFNEIFDNNNKSDINFNEFSEVEMKEDDDI